MDPGASTLFGFSHSSLMSYEVMTNIFPSYLALATQLFFYVQAQRTTVQCGTSYDWVRRQSPHDWRSADRRHAMQMNNTLGQSPCLVAAWLDYPCQGGESCFR